MAAGRVAGDGDLVGIDAEASGVGAHPAERRLDVVDLRRPLGFAGEAVLRGDADVADAAEQDAVAVQLRAITGRPAAAVHEEHGRPLVALLRRHVDVALQVASSARSVHDVVVDRHPARLRVYHQFLRFLRLNASTLRRPGATRKLSRGRGAMTVN